MIEKLAEKVLTFDESGVKEIITQLLAEGVDPQDIVEKGLISGMNVVGKRFKNGEMFVPEVLLAAKVMKQGMELIEPQLGGKKIKKEGTVILGTVKGDLHDIGKNLVGMMLESSGFNVINLGMDVEGEEFARVVEKERPEVLGLSALLTTTMLEMESVIEILNEQGLRERVKVIIGGAPVTQEFCDSIGADGFAPDAASATELVQRLIKQ